MVLCQGMISMEISWSDGGPKVLFHPLMYITTDKSLGPPSDQLRCRRNGVGKEDHCPRKCVLFYGADLLLLRWIVSVGANQNTQVVSD
jgi:hypothetical protein